MYNNIFEKLSLFIKDYIYNHNWQDLRQIQVKACENIFNQDTNLILSSKTASGKTEAAFLPILTLLKENPPKSVGVLYISPIKALINDQFYRLEELLEEAYIKVYKWHGDANLNEKKKLLKNPEGILQITPESLESLLINKPLEINNLFSDLRFIIIDEIHTFIGTDRGMQVICCLKRLQDITKNIPRRIGLSATIGDAKLVEEFLSANTNRKTITETETNEMSKIRLHLEHFYIGDMENGFPNYVYKNTLNKRAIIFGNQKAEIESVIAHLRRIAEQNNTSDIYNIHHGNISKTLREDTEEKMKKEDGPIVTGATVTLELGIDIGNLELAVQLNSPYSVSSFLQRLGRTGRRGNPPQMLIICKENGKDIKEIPLKQINWDFIQAIGILELYIKEKWIEPVESDKYPFSLLYQQTMSLIYSNIELSPGELAEKILTIEVFKNITKEDYKIFLKHLIEINHIEKTETGTLIIGLKGEPIVNSFEFYSVFETNQEYLVRNENTDIGTIHFKLNIGEKFILAGKGWKVINIDEKNNVLFVENVKGNSGIYWKGEGFFIHTKILKKMKEILEENIEYAYLSENAKKRLKEIREIYNNNNLNNTVVKFSSHVYAILPWLGTRELITFKILLELYGIKILDFNANYIIVDFRGEKEDLYEIIKKIKNIEINKYSLQIEEEVPRKYNKFIPKELLHKQYIEDIINIEKMKENLL